MGRLVVLAGAAFATLSAVGAARSRRRRRRTGWGLLALAAAIPVVDVLARPSLEPTSVPPAALAGPLLVAALLVLPLLPRGVGARLRLVIDGLATAAALLLLAWLSLGTPRATGAADLARLVGATADVVALAVVVAVKGRTPGGRVAPELLTGGLLALTVADGLSAYLLLRGHDSAATPLAAVSALGWVLIGLAARRPLPESAAATGSVAESTPLRLLLPYLPVLVAPPVAAASMGRTGHLGAFPVLDGLLLVVLLVVRQFVALFENARLAASLAHAATHDALTGLANRTLLMRRLDDALAARAWGGPAPAVLLLDLDRFKAVNDSLGHGAGDELLVAVAERLRAAVGPHDHVARLGGDEFAVVVVDARRADKVARRALRALGAPVLVADRSLVPGASIGVADTALGDGTAAALLRDADLAMYAAKAGGGGRVCRFEPHHREALLERLELEADLRQTVAEGRLVLHYQPVVDLATGEILSFEALVRWRHPRRGLLGPEAFVDVAEETGLSAALAVWVLHSACRAAAAWNGDLERPVGVCVNVSAQQLSEPGLTGIVTAALEASALAPELLTLELTESALIRDNGRAVARIVALKRLGVRVAIDDFGTGFSSLRCLRHLPVDVLKLDGSFIRGLGSPTGDEALPAAIVQLAGALEVQVVAEGVEHDGQRERLQVLGVAAGQGFLFGYPAEAVEPRALLAPTVSPQAA